MKFGDVISYNGREYAYLAQTPEIIYLAAIVNEEVSKKLIDQRDKIFMCASKNATVKQQKISWCFITLTTEEFKSRIAHYGIPENEISFADISTNIGTLNKDDQNKLKDEIVNDNGASIKLREIVKDIVLES
jgi:hypothetical protein